jgi:hypothetical protein
MGGNAGSNHRATERAIHLGAIDLAAGLFDELAAGFDPIVSGVAGEGEFVTAFGEEIGAETDLVVGRLDGDLGGAGCWLFGG